MADKNDSKVESVAKVDKTVYVTEEAPDLPSADITVTRDLPVIDKRLIEARNAEAKANADRLK